jgi:hypothetical protein
MRTAYLTAVRHTIRAMANRLVRTVADVVVVRWSLFGSGCLLHHPAGKQGRMSHAWSECASAWVLALGLVPCAMRLAVCPLPKRAGKGRARPGMPGQGRQG